MKESPLESRIKAKIIETIESKLQDRQVIEEDDFWLLSVKNDLLLSSLEYVKLIIYLETIFGVEFTQKEIILSDEHTLETIVEYILEHKKEQ